MQTTEAPSPKIKIVDILIDNLKETLGAVDRAFLLAVIASAFVVVHGEQGDFNLNFKEKLEGAAKRSSQSGQAEITKETPQRQTDIPLLGFKAELDLAAIVAILCYWIFTIRAALQVRRIALLVSRLSALDALVLEAVLLRPSLATAGPIGKVLSCLSLGVLGYGSYVSTQLPYNKFLLRSTSQTLIEAAVMLIPAIWLCWQLLTLSKHNSPIKAG